MLALAGPLAREAGRSTKGSPSAYPLNGTYARVMDCLSYSLASISACLAVRKPKRKKREYSRHIWDDVVAFCLPIARMRQIEPFLFPFPGFFLGTGGGMGRKGTGGRLGNQQKSFLNCELENVDQVRDQDLDQSWVDSVRRQLIGSEGRGRRHQRCRRGGGGALRW